MKNPQCINSMKEKLISNGLFILIVFFLLIFLIIPTIAYCQSQIPLRIGAVLPLTGSSAAWGEQGRWGIEFAVRKINKAGGINGRPVEVIYEDSQALPRLAITAFRKLSKIDRVPAVIGDIVSATTLAMAPFAQEQKIVLIAISASAPSITDAGEFIFRVWPSDLLEGTVAATWVHSQGFKKVSILHIANEYGTGLAGAFKGEWGNQGGEIVSLQSYAQDQTDFRSYLIRIKAESPEAVYLISYYKDAALALKQAKGMGLHCRFIGATAVESPDLLSIAGDAAEGLVYPTIVDFDPTNPTKSQKEFIDEFKALNGKEPDWAGSHAHDAALVILETLKSGARTGEEIRQYIDSTREFHGVTGFIRFDKNGDVVDKPVMMKTVRNGSFEVLDEDN